jgi:hypothetical protein
MGWNWVHLVRRPLIGLLYQPWMIDDKCGAVGGMRICRGNRSTLRKPALVPLCQSQIPRNLTWDRTKAAEVGSRRLTAWAMVRPWKKFSHRTVRRHYSSVGAVTGYGLNGRVTEVRLLAGAFGYLHNALSRCKKGKLCNRKWGIDEGKKKSCPCP